MATTDRGSGAIVPTASMGATLTGVLIVTGADQRAIAASDEGGLTLIASAADQPAKSCRSRARADQYRLTFLKRSDGCSGFLNQSLKSRRNVACAVSAQNEMNLDLLR
jgi:hypothetical protein